MDTISQFVTHSWIWAPAAEVRSILHSSPTYCLLGYKKTPAWALLVSGGAISACDEIQLWRIHLLLDDMGTSYITTPIAPQSSLLCRAITMQMQMQVALDEKNLGRWAELMQFRTRYLPFGRHPSLTMAHRLSHVHHWWVAVTPPKYTWSTTYGSRLFT